MALIPISFMLQFNLALNYLLAHEKYNVEEVMKKYIALILILFAAPSLCIAATGRDLLTKCERGKGTGASLYCVGFITGVSNVYNKLEIVCPNGETYGQQKKVALEYLRNNPELLDSSADDLVRDALKKAYPCN